MSNHQWTTRDRDIYVGYDRHVKRFFIIIDQADALSEDEPILTNFSMGKPDIHPMEIYATLIKYDFSPPENLISTLLIDKSMEEASNASIDPIDYGPPPKFLHFRRPKGRRHLSNLRCYAKRTSEPSK